MRTIQTIKPKKYMKYANEFGYAGQMLPIRINYMFIRHTLTYRTLRTLKRLKIYRTVLNR